MGKKKKASILNMVFPLGEQDSQFWDQLKQLDEIREELDDSSQGLQITVKVNGQETFVPFVRFAPLMPTKAS